MLLPSGFFGPNGPTNSIPASGVKVSASHPENNPLSPGLSQLFSGRPKLRRGRAGRRGGRRVSRAEEEEEEELQQQEVRGRVPGPVPAAPPNRARASPPAGTLPEDCRVVAGWAGVRGMTTPASRPWDPAEGGGGGEVARPEGGRGGGRGGRGGEPPPPAGGAVPRPRPGSGAALGPPCGRWRRAHASSPSTHRPRLSRRPRGSSPGRGAKLVLPQGGGGGLGRGGAGVPAPAQLTSCGAPRAVPEPPGRPPYRPPAAAAAARARGGRGTRHPTSSCGPTAHRGTWVS